MPQPFTAKAAHSYTDGPPRQVPGFASLHRMTNLLLAETAPTNGHILVLGAGGGLELKAMAEFSPGWHFDGVDPSQAMLDLARATAADHLDRIVLHAGTIAAAPPGPFDGATSLLVFHFIPRQERLATLIDLRERLRPGAPLILAHVSFDQSEPARSRWIARHVAFGAANDTSPHQLASAREAIATRLSILSPQEEEDLLHQAGFKEITQFYAAFSFRGWIAYAP